MTTGRASLLIFPPMIDGELARFALDHYRIPYDVTPHIALVSNAIAYARTGAINVPVLTTAGRHVGGTRQIIDDAEARALPDRKLVPADPAAARQVEADWALYNGILAGSTAAYCYQFLLPRRDLMVDPLSHGAPGWEVALTSIGYPVFRWFIGKVLGLGPERTVSSLREIKDIFDRTDARIADGRRFLVGDGLTLGDIALAAAAGPVVLPEGYGAPIPPIEKQPAILQALVQELRRRPTAAFVQNIYRMRPSRA